MEQKGISQKILDVVDTVHVTNVVKRDIFHQYVLLNQFR